MTIEQPSEQQLFGRHATLARAQDRVDLLAQWPKCLDHADHPRVRDGPARMREPQIAERLFVSENTVKTHAGRLFTKLSARRRTQAVKHAKEAGLIP